MGDEAVGWGVELPPDAPENPDVDARWTDRRADIAAELERMPGERESFWGAQGDAPAGESAPSDPAVDARWSDQKQDIADELAQMSQQRSDFRSDPANEPDPSTQSHDDAERLERYQQMDADHRYRFGEPSWGVSSGAEDVTGPPDAGWSDQKDDIAEELAGLPAQRAEFWSDPDNQPDPATQEHNDPA